MIKLEAMTADTTKLYTLFQIHDYSRCFLQNRMQLVKVVQTTQQERLFHPFVSLSFLLWVLAQTVHSFSSVHFSGLMIFYRLRPGSMCSRRRSSALLVPGQFLLDGYGGTGALPETGDGVRNDTLLASYLLLHWLRGSSHHSCCGCRPVPPGRKAVLYNLLV